MRKTIAHEDYVKACLVVESLINQVDDNMGEDHALMKEFLAASDIIEQYEEAHYPIGLPALADVIRLRMEEMRLKNIDLAKLLNTTPSRISEYLNGKRDVTLKVAKDLQRKLNIDSDIILNG
jgi:HTH-type transcriptional regulator/antitoxin HigA